MIADVLRFIGFIAVLVLLFLAAVKLINLTNRATQDKMLLRGRVFSLLTVATLWVGVFGLVWTISGRWEADIVLLVLAGVAVVAVAGGLFGLLSPSLRRRTNVLGVAIDNALRHPRATRFVDNQLALVMIVAYVLGAAWTIFATSGDARARLAIQLSLLFIYGISLPSQIQQARVLASPYLDDPSRDMLVSMHAIGTLGFFLPLSILFSSLTSNRAEVDVAVGGISIGINLWSLALLSMVFALLTWLPYLAGARKGRIVRADLDNSKCELLDTVAAELRKPTPDQYDEKLTGLQSRIRRDREKLLEDHAILEIAADEPEKDTSVEEDSATPVPFETRLAQHLAQSVPTLAGVERSIEQLWLDVYVTDPRFRQASWYQGLSTEIGEIRANLGSRPDARERQLAAATWADTLDRQAEDLEKSEPGRSKARPPAIAAAAVLVGAVGSALLDRLGTSLLDSISNTLIG